MAGRVSNRDKLNRGTFNPSRDVEAKITKPMHIIPEPFFPLSESQERFYKIACNWLISNDALKPLFIPQITRYAVTLDMYMRAKVLADEQGPVQVFSTGASNVSGAMTALDRLEKQLATIESKFGFDLKSYGTLKMSDSEEDATADDFR